jgi:hypothetical protein
MAGRPCHGALLGAGLRPRRPRARQVSGTFDNYRRAEGAVAAGLRPRRLCD